MTAFANKKKIGFEGSQFIPTFTDMLRSIYHELFIHMNQNLGISGFEKNGKEHSVRAAKEMEAYWKMFSNVSGLEQASPAFVAAQWKIFITTPTVNAASSPSWQLMTQDARDRWLIPYTLMNAFVNSYHF